MFAFDVLAREAVGAVDDETLPIFLLSFARACDTTTQVAACWTCAASQLPSVVSES